MTFSAKLFKAIVTALPTFFLLSVSTLAETQPVKVRDLPSPLVLLLKPELTQQPLSVGATPLVLSRWMDTWYAFQNYPAPPGGNARGSTWTLTISPADRRGLEVKKWPFLACARYRAHRYCGWTIEISESKQSLNLLASDVAQPCRPDFTWQDVFSELARTFTTCQNRTYP